MKLRAPSPSWRALSLIALGFLAVAIGAPAWNAVAPRRTPVLVYLANETRPGPAGAEAAAVVEGWLRASGDPEALAVAESLAEDRAAFPRAVDEEVRALAASAVPALLVATNASLRDGFVLARDLARDTGGPLQRRAVPVPPATGDAVIDENPLATPAGLRRALAAARTLFPPAEHEYVVLLKSHGRSGLAAVPRLTVRPGRSSSAEVLALVRGEGTPSADGLRREDIFELLEELGLPVSLLVLEACEAGQGLRSDEMPASVCAVAASLGPLDYRGFDLASLGSQPARALIGQVEKRAGMGLLRRPTGPGFLTVLPLALVVAVLVREGARSGRATRACRG